MHETIFNLFNLQSIMKAQPIQTSIIRITKSILLVSGHLKSKCRSIPIRGILRQ